MKWAIDPGVDGDVYGDRPHLYGNALSSVNVLRVGGKAGKRKQGGETGNVQSKNEDGEVKEEEEKVVEEGGEAGGDELRAELGVPADAAGRKKWFLKAGSTEGWVWEAGREYWVDFFNPYLDFNREIALYPCADCYMFAIAWMNEKPRLAVQQREGNERRKALIIQAH